MVRSGIGARFEGGGNVTLFIAVISMMTVMTTMVRSGIGAGVEGGGDVTLFIAMVSMMTVMTMMGRNGIGARLEGGSNVGGNRTQKGKNNDVTKSSELVNA